jgi:hypothetical protein
MRVPHPETPAAAAEAPVAVGLERLECWGLLRGTIQ